MPIAWRYLLNIFAKTFLLCISSFILLLLVTRLDSIARFILAGASASKIFLFILYQIPFTLPIAISLSSFLSSIILFQSLSKHRELTSLRTLSLSVTNILLPLLIVSLFLSFFNFILASEIAPRSRYAAKTLAFKASSSNPLFVLQNKLLSSFNNCLIGIDHHQSENLANNLIFASKGVSNRLTIVQADELRVDEGTLHGKDVSIISYFPTNDESFDHLVIDHQKEICLQTSSLIPHVSPLAYNRSEYLPLKFLIAKMFFPTQISSKKHTLRIFAEIAKRITLGLSVFTFTLLGSAFGMETENRYSKSRGRLLLATFLTLFFITCFFTAKSIRLFPVFSIILYFLPHPIIILFSMRSIQSISKGVQ